MDSERRFQHVLEACGVNKSLMKLGVKEGDTVIVGEVCCFLFLDYKYTSLFVVVIDHPHMILSINPPPS